MSVQNLRNKFSQNNGTVPYNPHPGLSYGKPVASSTLNNNNNHNNNNNNNHVTNTNKYQQNGMDGLSRFKTIREEPDNAVIDAEKPPVTKNSSFLQSYLTNEIARNSGGSPTVNGCNKSLNPVRVSKYSARPSAIIVSDVASKFGTALKSLSSPVSSHSMPEMATSKYSGTAVKSDTCSPKFTAVKSVLPSKFSAVTAIKSLPVLDSGGSTNIDNRWKTKLEDVETKRKTLLTQSQKREYTFF